MRHFLTAATLCFAALAVTPVVAAPKDCPPGLAKKSPACVPPGQAKKFIRDRDDGQGHRYRIGDRVDGEYFVLRDPSRWGLNARHTYYRIGDEIFRVDSDTRRVLDFIGLASVLLR